MCPTEEKYAALDGGKTQITDWLGVKVEDAAQPRPPTHQMIESEVCTPTPFACLGRGRGQGPQTLPLRRTSHLSVNIGYF